MPFYNYRARDLSGKSVKGEMEAETKSELADRLGKMGFVTTQIAEARVGALRVDSFLNKLKHVSLEDMVMFDVQLSNMINAGIALLPSLKTLDKQVENHRLKETLEHVARNVEEGETFSEALTRHPRIFPKIFIHMVKAGEASGKLDTILARLALFAEHEADLNQKVKNALFYPVILLGAGVALILYIVTFVIPQFAEIFTRSGITLPLPTLMLYHAGLAIKKFWYLILLAGMASAVDFTYYAGTVRGRYSIDRMKLAIPIVGPLLRKASISRFGRTLGMLVAAGVPILQSLEIVHDVIGNEVLSRVISSVRNAVEKGEKISEPLRVSEEFPPDVVHMIAVGEESGNLDEMLNKISDFYDKSIEYSLKKLTTVLEPILLSVMGCMVGMIMASLLLPMFDMIKTLRH